MSFLVRVIKYINSIYRRHIGTTRVGDVILLRKDGHYANRSSSYKSLLKSVKLFNQLKGETIVELGSGIHGNLAGNSILVWANKSKAKRIIAVDLSKEMIQKVIDHTKQHNHIETVVGDALEFVRDFQDPIDLLYLDISWTPDPEGVLQGSGIAQAYLDAYKGAKENLSQTSMILIDDTDHVLPYKQSYIIPEARKDGFKVVYVGRQTLLLREEPT